MYSVVQGFCLLTAEEEWLMHGLCMAKIKKFAFIQRTKWKATEGFNNINFAVM